ncbi:MAG TPA: PRC-barrel domain-containing protein [Allosphingosinicella sp.]|jgi:hypothetical protein
MNIWKHIEHDHAELHSLGQDILKSSDGGDPGGRDNQFDLYDLQVRRHLAVIEDVLLPPLRKEERSRTIVSDLQSRHKELRKTLSWLDRPAKGTSEWTAEFRDFIDLFEGACAQHETLVKQAKLIFSDFEAADLGEQYQKAKLSRIRGRFSWNRVGIGVAGAAVAAGAAFAANRYFSSGRRRTGRAEDDFELRLETDENLRLIASSKVEGTPVVGRNGESLGRIENFMVDKYTGRVAYAVMSFGGALGFGRSLFPLPWPLLEYDEQQDGYALDISKEELANAPRFQPENHPEFTPEYRRQILVFYTPGESAGARGGSEGSDSVVNSAAASRPAIGGASRTSAPQAAPSFEPAPAGK